MARVRIENELRVRKVLLQEVGVEGGHHGEGVWQGGWTRASLKSRRGIKGPSPTSVSGSRHPALKGRQEDLDDGEGWHCPEGKMEVRDCTSYPCKVECQ
jgi:hypothetical protein